MNLHYRIIKISEQDHEESDDPEEGEEEFHAHDFFEDEEFGETESDNRHHEGESGPEGDSLRDECLDDREDTGRVGVHRYPEDDRDRHREGIWFGDILLKKSGWDESVDDSADKHSDQDVGHNLPDERETVSAHGSQKFVPFPRLFSHFDGSPVIFPDKFRDLPLHIELADDPSAEHPENYPGGDIDRRDFETEESDK